MGGCCQLKIEAKYKDKGECSMKILQQKALTALMSDCM